ncbi:MAG TPA: 6-carboxytetrahydropterin synthase [Bacteroidales bacterium]|nr:6-carboxytetrahydropterin synthase [Bacteroidales bacterium]
MATIRISKEFVFDMAHALHKYDGLCKNIHGHTYKLQVTLRGPINTDEDSTKLGMVLDFSELKRIVKIPIVDKFDHALAVNTRHGMDVDVKHYQEEGKFIELPFQPTCENLVVYFAEIIQKELPSHVDLYSLRLYETPTSWGEWYADDNM